MQRVMARLYCRGTQICIDNFSFLLLHFIVFINVPAMHTYLDGSSPADLHKQSDPKFPFSGGFP